jgi:hypothetical protein
MRSLSLVVLLGLAGCGSEGGSDDRALKVSWVFETGSCTSNNITKVKVSWGAVGETKTDVEFDCSAGEGTLGETSASGGSYGITAVGLDSGGVARVTHFGTTLNVGSGGTHGIPVDLTLRPKPAKVTLTWGDTSSACPGQTVLPYTLTLYNPPATTGATPTDQVDSTQVSCSAGTATFTNLVSPGDYIADLDSRAISPMVKSTKPITVVAGEDLTVSMF